MGGNGANRAAKEGKESAGHNKKLQNFFLMIKFEFAIQICWSGGFPPLRPPLPPLDCRVEQLFNLVARLNYLDGTWMRYYIIVVR